ncbi:hypothetical protein AS850_12255 [Frondihabitans sp. 762G35]|uniref:hypothetical protein n=1 Tax=Frondihabitans sp. 762G35 TaxID=1446794 RepID=UPI000D2259C2|nr:hypothetical protein [Frondihabitans sp. 762G35]ARC57847.1 hypothetical protein AS850_12255 [Frondihabitans sp. 762G35]
MRIERVAGAAIAVGVLAVTGILLFGPRQAEVEAAHPVPVLEPITPSGFPYSQLAVLRQQRMSDDVLPAGFLSVDTRLVPESARRLGTIGGDGLWIAVDATNEVCILSIGPGKTGSASLCSGVTSAAPGSAIGDGALGEAGFAIVADGTPAVGAVPAGYRQIAPNVWLQPHTSAKAAPVARSTFSDPAAFPRAKPYSDFAILRRDRTAQDAPPKSLDEDASTGTQIVTSTVRYAGAYRAAKIWVGVDTRGHACLVVANDGGLATSCAVDENPQEDSAAAAVGVQDMFAALVADGVPDSVGLQGSQGRKLTTGVFAGPEG